MKKIRRMLGLRDPEVEWIDVRDEWGLIGRISILETLPELAQNPESNKAGKFYSVVAVPWRGKHAHWYVADLDEAHRTVPEAETYIREIAR